MDNRPARRGDSLNPKRFQLNEIIKVRVLRNRRNSAKGGWMTQDSPT